MGGASTVTPPLHLLLKMSVLQREFARCLVCSDCPTPAPVAHTKPPPALPTMPLWCHRKQDHGFNLLAFAVSFQADRRPHSSSLQKHSLLPSNKAATSQPEVVKLAANQQGAVGAPAIKTSSFTLWCHLWCHRPDDWLTRQLLFLLDWIHSTAPRWTAGIGFEEETAVGSSFAIVKCSSPSGWHPGSSIFLPSLTSVWSCDGDATHAAYGGASLMSSGEFAAHSPRSPVTLPEDC